MIAALLACGFALAAEPLWSEDLQDGDGGFSSYGETGQWAWGEPGGGPAAGFDGSACWATGLDGWYLNDATDYLGLPVLPLAEAARPVLEFQHWYSIWEGDLVFVEAERDGGWEPLEPVYGYPVEGGFSGAGERWEPVWFDLTGLDPSAGLRLVLQADRAGAAPGWFVDAFRLYDGDVVPPRLEPAPCLADTEDLAGPYAVEATVRDDVGLAEVLLLYQVNGGTFESAPMVRAEADRWLGEIPGQPAGSAVSYMVLAGDGENEAFGPEPPCSFAVRLPAPTGLQAPDDLVWGDSAPLAWQAPVSSHPLLSYRVWRDGELVAEVGEARAEAPLVTGSQSFEVSAVYDVGEGTRSRPVEVVAAVPAVLGLDPAVAYQGDHLRVVLWGEYLLLQEGDVQVDLGPDVRVLGVEVRDVDLCWLDLFVSNAATPGPVDLSLHSGDARVSWPDAFEILPGSERPRLLGVEPGSIRQGEEETLRITASAPFASPPALRIGEAILVQSTALDPDGALIALVAAPYDTPLGWHPIEVDDGTRIYGGLELQIRDAFEPLDDQGGCAALPARRPAGGAVAALLLCLGRAYTLRRRPPSTGRATPRT